MLQECLSKLGEKLDKAGKKVEKTVEEVLKEIDETYTEMKSTSKINGVEIHVDENKNVKINGEVKSIILNDTEIYKI